MQPPLNSDGQQVHLYQQIKQPPLNGDGRQFHHCQIIPPISTKQTTSKQ